MKSSLISANELPKNAHVKGKDSVSESPDSHKHAEMKRVGSTATVLHQEELSNGGHYWCHCSVCKGLERSTVAAPSPSKITRSNNHSLFTGDILQNISSNKIEFYQIIEMLTSPSEAIKGAPILTPEIALFQEGKLSSLIKYDPTENELKKINNATSMQMHTLMKFLMNCYRHRKKGKITKSTRKTFSSASTSFFQPTRKSITSGSRGGTMAVVHYRDQENSTLLTENDFMQLMMIRPGSKQWNNVQYIQNYLATPKGTSETLIYKFYAPINPDSPDQAINYTLVDFETDEYLKIHDGYRYAQKLCTVIGYYLSKIRNIELLWMRASFLKDEHNNLWFYNAEEISVRKGVAKVIMTEEQKGAFYNACACESVMKELDSFSVEYSEKSKNVEAFYDAMQHNFEVMKEKAGLNVISIPTVDISQLDDAFEKLRPHSPYKLSEIVDPSFDPGKRSLYLKGTEYHKSSVRKRVMSTDQSIRKRNDSYDIKAIPNYFALISQKQELKRPGTNQNSSKLSLLSNSRKKLVDKNTRIEKEYPNLIKKKNLKTSTEYYANRSHPSSFSTTNSNFKMYMKEYKTTKGRIPKAIISKTSLSFFQ